MQYSYNNHVDRQNVSNIRDSTWLYKYTSSVMTIGNIHFIFMWMFKKNKILLNF